MMSRSNDELDKLIREALETSATSDQQALDHLGDPSLADLLAETFRGRHRRLAVGGVLVNLLVFAAAIWCGVRFLRADTEREMLLWGAGMLLGFGMVAAIKIWYWLEMNRLALTREIKRVELQVVQLGRKLRGLP
jgi:hypothetical protein